MPPKPPFSPSSFPPLPSLYPTIPTNPLTTRLSHLTADLTTLPLPAILNAANSTLLGGGGIDGAIHHAAGPDLLRECRSLGGCAVGKVKVTHGYRLPAAYVVHAVGPVYSQYAWPEEADQLLASCYRNALDKAKEYEWAAIGLCAVSTGVYGFPKKRAARIAISEVSRWLAEEGKDSKLERIVFVTYPPDGVYDEILVDIFDQDNNKNN